MKRIFNWEHIYVTLITIAIVVVSSMFVMNLRFFNPVSRALASFNLSDIYYQMLQEGGYAQESSLITIVDATSLYDRSRIGEMMDQVTECEPAVVGIDCIYQGFRGDTLGTERLIEGALCLPNSTFAMKLVDNGTRIVHSHFAPLDGLNEGYSNVQWERSSYTLRSYVTDQVVDGDTVHSLPYMIARTFSESVEEQRTMEPKAIDYTPTKFSVVHCDSILQNKDLLKNRIVIIGAMHDDADMHFSPYGRTAGTLIQAYIVQTLLEQHPNKEVPFAWVIIISILLTLVSDIFQTELAYWSEKHKNAWISFFISLTLVKSIINFCWIGILLYINFLIFALSNIYFNPSFALICIALLVEGRLFYNSLKTLHGKGALKFIKKK